MIIGSFETMTEQNKRLAEEIIRLSKEESHRLSDIAILVRTNLGAGAVIQKLLEYNIPFIAGDNLPNIYDHWITLDLVSYIRIAMGEANRDLYLRIINRPMRYIGRECFDTPIVKLRNIKNYYEDRQWMLKRVEQLEYDLAMLANMTPFAAIQYIKEESDMRIFLRNMLISGG